MHYPAAYEIGMFHIVNFSGYRAPRDLYSIILPVDSPELPSKHTRRIWIRRIPSTGMFLSFDSLIEEKPLLVMVSVDELFAGLWLFEALPVVLCLMAAVHTAAARLALIRLLKTSKGCPQSPPSFNSHLIVVWEV